jgi:two-component system OmpR family response regulator
MRVLLIEDEPVLGEAVQEQVAADGHAVDWVTRLDEADAALRAVDYGLVLLDLHLPDGRGLDLLKTMRRGGDKRPVIILTARDQISDRIEGLNAGADDYLVKPFAFAELLARVEALLRRRSAPVEQTRLQVGDLEMDLLTHKVARDGRPIELQPREFRVLEYLMRHTGQVVTRTMLLENVWDMNFDPQTNVVDVHISRLRQKIDKGFDAPLLHTVRGAGYRLAEDG